MTGVFSPPLAAACTNGPDDPVAATASAAVPVCLIKSRRCMVRSPWSGGWQWRVSAGQGTLLLTRRSLPDRRLLATGHPLLFRFLKTSRRDDGKLIGVKVLAQGGVDVLDGEILDPGFEVGVELHGPADIEVLGQ